MSPEEKNSYKPKYSESDKEKMRAELTDLQKQYDLELQELTHWNRNILLEIVKKYEAVSEAPISEEERMNLKIQFDKDTYLERQDFKTHKEILDLKFKTRIKSLIFELKLDDLAKDYDLNGLFKTPPSQE